jgi:hypothetical protein
VGESNPGDEREAAGFFLNDPLPSWMIPSRI